MTLSNCRATFGLNAKVTPTKAGSNGTLQVGDNNETLSLTAATKIVSFDAVIVGIGSDLVVDISALNNTGSTAWTAGAAQVETATAAGTISGAGNASIIVTAAGMTGSPKTISVAVAASDTAATWAGKVRTALAADSAVAAMFTVSGTTTAIVLTRKPTSTYTVNGTAVNVYPANDATLNISLDNGTCTGITTAATSTNTTAGVATSGAYCPDLDGTDFEGEATGGLVSIYGVKITNSSDSKTNARGSNTEAISSHEIKPGGALQEAGTTSPLDWGDISIIPLTGGDDSCHVTITLAGS